MPDLLEISFVVVRPSPFSLNNSSAAFKMRPLVCSLFFSRLPGRFARASGLRSLERVS